MFSPTLHANVEKKIKLRWFQLCLTRMFVSGTAGAQVSPCRPWVRIERGDGEQWDRCSGRAASLGLALCLLIAALDVFRSLWSMSEEDAWKTGNYRTSCNCCETGSRMRELTAFSERASACVCVYVCTLSWINGVILHNICVRKHQIKGIGSRAPERFELVWCAICT